MSTRATIPGDPPPVFDGATLQLQFVVEIDGVQAECAITAEALEDHFGARSALEADLREAFERGRQRIAEACADVVADGHGGAVLHSGYFRVQRRAAAALARQATSHAPRS
ncbi:DUF1488 domain-containing protein [Burkholderia multivorans]|jgi:hypothetical protein|uniref:DUF1488 domain-containing protein n=1 Tax=Burkholderia multivorans TaxID=87883 RepID=UPI00057D1F30|nr:DUF1488 domain-containing protein [Burkholderia multivorans]EKS9913387.1 DUF1488 domain-containing protein [Burkholderia multivorans]KHS09865.1 hypothetical protein BMD20_25990 [Burkholderia multivorans]KHS15140.1 hypothetical protein BMD22_20675 [Burkholderia multivorans]KOE22769.1 hypothetical protein AI46_27985 [Burkholderia multivorans R-20526]KVT37803.1 hypothetical protein WK52_00950 [Burkholderia multivorans]